MQKDYFLWARNLEIIRCKFHQYVESLRHLRGIVSRDASTLWVTPDRVGGRFGVEEGAA